MTTGKTILREWNEGVSRRKADQLALEEPLEIRVETRSVCVTMRTPGHDQELAAGFLVSEALIQHPRQLLRIEGHPRNAHGNVVNVFVAPEVTVDFVTLTRHVFASSSCGLCGKGSIEAVQQHFDRIKSDLSVPVSVLRCLPEQLTKHQAGFAQTGGLHAAAVFDAHGRLVVVREDVGRHNAVDKVVGFGLLQGLLPFDRHILMVSGRASFEILQKALAAGIPIVAAVSAPSSLAVEFARRNRQTLIGFLRGSRMNVYAGFKRVR